MITTFYFTAFKIIQIAPDTHSVISYSTWKDVVIIIIFKYVCQLWAVLRKLKPADAACLAARGSLQRRPWGRLVRGEVWLVGMEQGHVSSACSPRSLFKMQSF